MKFQKFTINNPAFIFILFLGIVSLFADMTYEGARSISGAYLALLGASGTTVGVVAGLGELIGYGLRFFSGLFADRSERYWLMILSGYTINLIAVPLLAFAGNWPMAAFLIVLERFGKAVRVPARDTLLAQASQSLGMGWGFGLHQALDQTGAMLGPFVVALVLLLHGNYQTGFAVLFIPAIAALLVLFITYRRYAQTPLGMASGNSLITAEKIANKFWIYLAATSFIAAGYADFPLIAFHFQKTHLWSPMFIPFAYGIAMSINIIMGPLLGKLYDRHGLILLLLITLLTAFFAPLVFLGNKTLAFCGVALWAVGMGVQDSLLRAIVGNMMKTKRGTAYGIFNLVYGLCWFLGSALLGMLYDFSLYGLVIVSVILQCCAIPLLWVVV